MIRKLLMRITDRLPAREIRGPNDAPYLERYYVGRLFGWTVYLHRFLAPDPGRGVHDHPWDISIAVPLVGGYTEYRLRGFSADAARIDVRRAEPWRPRVIRGDTFHRIIGIDAHLHPVGDIWTLFAHRHRVKGWGFLTWGPRFSSTGTLLGLDLLYRPHRGGGPIDWHLTAPTGRELRERQAAEAAAERHRKFDDKIRRINAGSKTDNAA